MIWNMAEFRRNCIHPMREFLKVPTRVEVVRAQEIIFASAENLDSLPHRLRECYEVGQMIISATGVTFFNGQTPVRARPEDFVVWDHSGIFSVYNPTAFEQSFVPAHSSNIVGLRAA
jgi:hypothetical protein